MTNDELDRVLAGALGLPLTCDGECDAIDYNAFGCRVCGHTSDEPITGTHEHGGRPSPYSTDGNAMLTLLDVLADRGLVVCLKADGLRRALGTPRYTVFGDFAGRVDADTAPRAVAEAALRVLRGKP